MPHHRPAHNDDQRTLPGESGIHSMKVRRDVAGVDRLAAAGVPTGADGRSVAKLEAMRRLIAQDAWHQDDELTVHFDTNQHGE